MSTILVTSLNVDHILVVPENLQLEDDAMPKGNQKLFKVPGTTPW